MGEHTTGEQWASARGTVVRGHRVASGTGEDRRYPSGTIRMQKPFFRALGLDLGPYYEGTLNVSISPRAFALRRPQHTYRQVAWTALHPPEDFSFSRCRLTFRATIYNGWVYYPHPETKRAHFQPPSTIEIIAPPIPAIGYGDQVEVAVLADEVELLDAPL